MFSNAWSHKLHSIPTPNSPLGTSPEATYHSWTRLLGRRPSCSDVFSVSRAVQGQVRSVCSPSSVPPRAAVLVTLQLWEPWCLLLPAWVSHPCDALEAALLRVPCPWDKLCSPTENWKSSLSQLIPRNSLDLHSGEWMQMCLNKRESYEGGEVGRQILFFWCKSSTVLMFRRIRLAVTAHPLQGITYFFILAWLFIKPPVLKTPSHLMCIPAKAEKGLGI